MKRENWPKLKEKMRGIFKTKTRDVWCAIMEGTDVCFAPVLSLDEAPRHAHMAARGSFVEIAGVTQPAPAPRFDRTPPGTPNPPAHAGQHSDEVLGEFGFSADEIAGLRQSGAIA